VFGADLWKIAPHLAHFLGAVVIIGRSLIVPNEVVTGISIGARDMRPH
jgi:hypothetical protein